MSKRNDGGLAFPTEADLFEDAGGYMRSAGATTGMSLRDYFAGQALVAIGTWAPDFSGSLLEGRAQFAYAQADAMLKARRGR